ncbi:ABATE domain-containing protein [Umezawaea sp. Da 62-37]|uniref:CGNR zinc finger domain-containing protein n=1 Tax=Umezawaea sp. Da 62-37 TaxID=3075927 RepID=UPI0028F727C8|nr:ABATE domain-containing protein [Umezawaea sp. Da 62-37]WNV86910.1 ABATE domain-containing protein [Umezawaea sp. Da 62-37]
MEFPILGTEPLPVELANTVHGADDFLGTAEWAGEWFALMGQAPVDAGRARKLRDSVRRLFTAVVEGIAPDRADIAVVNGFATPTRLELDWSAGGPASRWRDTTLGGTAVLGRIATRAIELLAGPEALRRCTAPGCSMFYVRDHPRRRWCNPSCGHRDRQARYYRRHRRPEVSP